MVSTRSGSFLGCGHEAHRQRHACTTGRTHAARPHRGGTGPEITIYTRCAGWTATSQGTWASGRSPALKGATLLRRPVAANPTRAVCLPLRSGTSPWWGWQQARLYLVLALKLVLERAESNQESRGGAAALRPPSLDALEMKWPRRREMHRSSRVAA